ncbi:hypothetical protein D3C71_1362880 [compost metagenome]
MVLHNADRFTVDHQLYAYGISLQHITQLIQRRFAIHFRLVGSRRFRRNAVRLKHHHFIRVLVLIFLLLRLEEGLQIVLVIERSDILAMQQNPVIALRIGFDVMLAYSGGGDGQQRNTGNGTQPSEAHPAAGTLLRRRMHHAGFVLRLSGHQAGRRLMPLPILEVVLPYHETLPFSLSLIPP